MIDEINDNVAACKQIDHDQRLKTLTVHVHYYKDYSGKDAFSVASFDQSKYTSDYIHIGTTELVYLIPEAFDPVALEVSALRRKKMDVINEYTKRLKEIEEQIGKLTAIEHTPAEF
jgi:hypothetical protein